MELKFKDYREALGEVSLQNLASDLLSKTVTIKGTSDLEVYPLVCGLRFGLDFIEFKLLDGIFLTLHLLEEDSQWSCTNHFCVRLPNGESFKVFSHAKLLKSTVDRYLYKKSALKTERTTERVST